MRIDGRSWGRAAAVVLAVALCGAAVRAADEPDPFAPGNQVSVKALAEAAPAAPAPGVAQGADKPRREPATAKFVDLQASVSPAEVRRGEVATVTIRGVLKPGYHTYPLTQRADNENQGLGQLAKLTVGPAAGLRPLFPAQENEPEWSAFPGLGSFLEHKKEFTFSQDVQVLPDAAPGEVRLPVVLTLQVCKDGGSCITGTHRFEPSVRISGAPAAALTAEQTARLNAAPAAVKVVAVPAGQASGRPQRKDTSLVTLLLTSMGAAVLMLLTPCVFPMVPITVSFFLKQSEKQHHNALLTAGVYTMTIIVVLALAVLVLGGLIIQWANSWWMNLGLGLVLVFFALSLLGMYEIELPSGLARLTSSQEGRGGTMGAVFMALTFTITSFTCTGPFLGPLLVATKEMGADRTRLALASLAYSATFAAPFFVLALFPSLLKKLPKSGGWLNSVKVVMGFLELAAALKFLGNTDVVLNPGRPLLFTYDTVLCAWIALSVLCGLYLLGLFRLPHDSPVESVGVPRMLLASVFVGLGLYMIPALFRQTPVGAVGSGLVAFLPLDTLEKSAVRGSEGGGHLDWHMDYQKAWEQATRENKLLFIDFTGVNCTNCRANENNVFPRKEVRDELQRFVRVQLYNDSVPAPGLSPAEAQAQAARNKEWQDATFGDISTPLYVIFQPDGTAPTDGNRLKGTELGRYAGFIADVPGFVEFLRTPQKKQVAMQQP